LAVNNKLSNTWLVWLFFQRRVSKIRQRFW
jgi:hypothetical protein